MTSEFNVIYKDSQARTQTMNVCAADKQEAMNRVSACGLMVVNVTHVRDFVDWSQPTFTLDEAAAYVRLSRTAFADRVTAGKIRYVKDGNGQKVYRKCDLETYLRENLWLEDKPVSLAQAA